MEIEITYNPYLIQTDLIIDGKPVEDAYGALFPVRNYPLQCWLEKNGSWMGCGATLASIARGEKLSLLFCGRQEDFGNFKESIRAYPWEKEQIVSVQYKPAFQSQAVRGSMETVTGLLKAVSPYPGDGSKRDQALIERINRALYQLNASEEIVKIDDPQSAEQREILKNSNSFCLVDCNKVDFEERRRMLDDFCHTMQRCSESIVFVEEHAGVRRCFNLGANYQRKYLNEEELSLLKQKYGVPFQIRQCMDSARDMVDGFRAVLSMRERFQRELRDMKAEMLDGMDVSDDEYERTTACIRWIHQNTEAVEKAGKLLEEIRISRGKTA